MGNGSSLLSPVIPSANISSKVSHTGIFSAQIGFTQPLRISWVNGSKEVQLGLFNLETLHARRKRAYINQTTDFTITDQGAFGQFTQFMITSSNFTWRLRSDQLHVRALSFPVSKGLRFEKDVTLRGAH
jgi:Protein of unknown function (DUF3712)